jgi:hypothetical protein
MSPRWGFPILVVYFFYKHFAPGAASLWVNGALFLKLPGYFSLNIQMYM